MGEHSPQSKPDEQYPLLKIDGGGDINHAQPAQTVVTPGWGVNCSKSSRFSRWPEFISACWMTLILCGISFLVFHALGMGFYRRQQFIIMKCNTSKPANNVYYHQLISRDVSIPFVLYTEYLANMATQYPRLNFHVFFLIDDYYTDSIRGAKRSISHYHSWVYNRKLDDISEEAFTEFEKKYQNVNVTIVPLSKYMAMTPLRFKWRLIPEAHLPFYIRVFSVWQNGGIGMDLRTFNNDYHFHLRCDPRIETIFRQHNNGINAVDYAKALNKIDNDEANAFFSMFSGLINHFLNETRSFFNRTLSLPLISEETSPLIRTHRSKRQISDISSNESESETTVATNDPKNFYNVDDNVTKVPSDLTKTKDDDIEVSKNASTSAEKEALNTTELKTSKAKNGSGTHQVVLFYDFSIISDGTGPSWPFNVHKPSDRAVLKTSSHLLSLDAEGMFIAASSRLHPFLAHLISAGCFGMHPKLAIQDALLTQCAGAFKEDVYCNNIYIL